MTCPSLLLNCDPIPIKVLICLEFVPNCLFPIGNFVDTVVGQNMFYALIVSTIDPQLPSWYTWMITLPSGNGWKWVSMGQGDNCQPTNFQWRHNLGAPDALRSHLGPLQRPKNPPVSERHGEPNYINEIKYKSRFTAGNIIYTYIFFQQIIYLKNIFKKMLETWRPTHLVLKNMGFLPQNAPDSGFAMFATSGRRLKMRMSSWPTTKLRPGGLKMGYPLVICYIAIGNGHL